MRTARTLGLILGLTATLAAGAALADPPPFPPGAQARETALLAHASPQLRQWVRDEGRREGGGGTQASATQAVREHFGPSMGSADVDGLAFLVLMEACRQSQQDLEQLAAEIKADNAAKQHLRQTLQQGPSARLPCRPGQPCGKTDPMGDDALPKQMRLQRALDHYDAEMQTLSNMLKKASDTNAGVSQNLK